MCSLGCDRASGGIETDWSVVNTSQRPDHRPHGIVAVPNVTVLTYLLARKESARLSRSWCLCNADSRIAELEPPRGVTVSDLAR